MSNDDLELVRDDDGVIGWKERDSNGGSITPVTHTATVTTDADAFLVTHDFDLGYPTVAYFGGTVTSLTPSGETFGGGAGDISVDVTALVSRDGTTWYGSATGGGVVGWPLTGTLQSAPAEVVAGAVDGMVVSPRYVRVLVFIYDNDAGDIYAGANHPRATCDLSVTAI